ncbi:uncharacterized protein MONBRDRAFT_32276 [Monosiga brevicollis MX1]|uniref:Peroxin-7 n=1 Tax=Monosiga brevicollis TaxID=81824 RepID=A9UYH9_MONBE|nr:uncharacterized protein MONBRDRAFT_32276 [Monosiga brevicollis MX1]EDQ89609.1 predicted protein [Monosiga brevicollis MX1]|eukprot:XP_001745638.1 hypothetical protein [Monosiga brevicollis MX1]
MCLDEPGTMGSLASALTSTMQRVSGRARVMGASNNGWSSPNKSIPFHTGATTLQRSCMTRDKVSILTVFWTPTLCPVVATCNAAPHNAHDAPITLRGHQGNVYDLTWHPGGRTLATVAADRMCYIWDTSSAHSPVQRMEHAHEVLACDWHKYHQHLVVTGCVDANVYVLCDVFNEHVVYSAGYDFATFAWDLRLASRPTSSSGPLINQHTCHSEFVTALAASTHEHVVIDGGWDARLQFYESGS